ncbi:Histidinol-phosphate aminotransferase [Buchnera aphidicola (Neophyllaphis podocarpi)]|uniref:histidinol-phosphate transaminase n=1 Tax=Buchnera aphidicola TaxID=9 RepID=UPI0031B82783
MNVNLLKLARKNIQTLIPYQSARLIGGKGNIFLNANESPNSESFSLTNKVFNRYPECQPKEILSVYSKYISLPLNNILVTRGSDESIELLIKTFCEPYKDSIMFFPPTYDMYHISAKILGINAVIIPKLSNFQLNLKLIESNSNSVKLIYICNPNNPTGNIIRHKDIIFILKLFEFKALVVIDEAYIDFCSENSMLKYLDKYPNLVILRTLSKAFALAGLRCGFTLANKNIIFLLRKVIAPYPLSSPVIDIVNQAFSSKNILITKKRILQLNYNRLFLVKELNKFDFIENIFNSYANYILVKFINANRILRFLQNKGIVLRNQSTKLNLNNCIRISIGTLLECKNLIKIFNLYKTFLYKDKDINCE